jgi:hypothetical protein
MCDRVALTLACLCALAVPVVGQTQGTARLLRVGALMIEPPELHDDEAWLGLRATNNGRELVRVTPTIVDARTTCGDRRASIATGGVDGVSFLISGVRALSAGAVMTSIDSPRALYPGETIDLNILPRDGFKLQALGAATPDAVDPNLANYTLWMQRPGQAQQLVRFDRSGFDNRRQIVWAGDLDHDLRPDVLFDFPLDGGGHEYQLFLSSMAGPGDLVGKAATFSAPGC